MLRAERACVMNIHKFVYIACSFVELEKDAIWEPGHVQVNCSVTYVRHLGGCRDILQLQRASYSETNGFPNYRLFFFFSFFLSFIFTLHATACPVLYERASRLSGSLFFSPSRVFGGFSTLDPYISRPELTLLSSIQSRHTILGRVRFRQRDNTSPWVRPAFTKGDEDDQPYVNISRMKEKREDPT